MRIVVDKMPKSCSECLFSKCGSHQGEAEYSCFCTLTRKEKVIYEWETLNNCPLIDYKTMKNTRDKIKEIY
jgi:hypothetical protein